MNAAYAGSLLQRMLPPLLPTVTPPPELLPTDPWPMTALPVPPAGVFTAIETAPAVVFVVRTEAAFWSYPSVPAPSVLAAIEIVPVPAFRFAPSVIASALDRLMFPEDVLVGPAMLRVPRRLVMSMYRTGRRGGDVRPVGLDRKMPPPPAEAVTRRRSWSTAAWSSDTVRRVQADGRALIVPVPVTSVTPVIDGSVRGHQPADG